MIPHTIAYRELRTRARQWGTYRHRTFAAVTAVGLVVVMMVMGELFGALTGMGTAMFRLLTWLAFAYSLFEGLRNTVDCLSSEKREGTLGLLFLTDLNGLDVVIGKLAANSLTCFYNLFAAFPAIAMPFILGGITGGEFWRTILALVATLFFALSTGMMTSAFGRSEQWLWGTGMGIMVVFCVGMPLLDLAIARGSLPAFVPYFSVASPPYVIVAAMDAFYTAHPAFYWSGPPVLFLISFLMLVVAGVEVMRSWRREPAGTPGESDTKQLKVEWAKWIFKERRGGAALRGRNPALWILERGGQLNLRAMILMGTLGIFTLSLWGLWCDNQVVAGTGAGLFYLLHWGLRIWTASVACYTMAGWRDSGMLELMAVSPLMTEQMAKSSYRAVENRFRGLAICLAVVEWIFMLVWLMQNSGNTPGKLVVIVLIAAQLVLFMDLYALTRAGAWYGLVTPNSGRAITRTVLYVLIFPMAIPVIIPICLIFCWVGFPFFFIFKDWLFLSTMEERLASRFREVIAQPLNYEKEATGWWPFRRAHKRQPPPLRHPVPPPL
jgi:hypothetical protein